MSTREDILLSSAGVKEGAFSSPGGGGMTFGGSFSPDGRITDSDENEEQFRRASDSMFKEGNDFMTNTDNAWIQQSSGSGSSNNPFLSDAGPTRKPDSGFISPACNSSNKSSDEDRKEDEEFLESQEVSKLLGGRPMEELLSRDTPTPPVDETGSSLEEILAAARDNPDSVGEVDDDDSDESSTDDSKPPPVKNSNSNQPANQNVSDSDENDEGDFTFVKEESQVKNLLADIQGDELENSSKPELSNGHHQDVEEEEGEGPSSVIIESQETPNPDSASFILKTTNSEAPELPSPQEPVVEVIMEGVGKASPILEEVEEEDRHFLPSSQSNKPMKESSELECDGEVEASSISFQCKEDDASFVLKTPNPSDNASASDEVHKGPTPPSGVEDSECEAQFLENDKEEEKDSTHRQGEEKDSVHHQEEVIEEIVEVKHVDPIGMDTLPSPIEDNHKESGDEHEDQSTGISTGDNEGAEADNKENANDLLIDTTELKNNVLIEVDGEEAPDQSSKPIDMSEKSEGNQEIEPQNEIAEDTPKEIVESPIIEPEFKVEVAAPTTSEIPRDDVAEKMEEACAKIESSTGEEKETKEDEEEIVQKEVVAPVEPLLEAIECKEQSKTVETISASAPSSKGGSPKKEAKTGGGLTRKSVPSTTKSASSSPKKTLSGSTSSSAKSTLNRRPASASKTTSVSKTVPKTTGTTTTTRPSPASRTTPTSKTTGLTSSKTSVPAARPSTTKPVTNSTLPKKPLSTSTSRATSATTSSPRSTRPASGEVKSKVDSSSKRETISKVGSKPISRVGASSKPSSLASQGKSNGTTTTTTAPTTRKPLSSRTTSSSSTLSKKPVPPSDCGSKAPSTKARSSLLSGKSTSSKAPGGVAPKRPTNVSAKVSTGLSRPKSSSSVKASAKPTENGAISPKASPVNGNAAISNEAVGP